MKTSISTVIKIISCPNSKVCSCALVTKLGVPDKVAVPLLSVKVKPMPDNAEGSVKVTLLSSGSALNVTLLENAARFYLQQMYHSAAADC